MSVADEPFDVVVVGSGAGAAAALSPLLARRLRVCVLERGADEPPAATPLESESGRGMAPYSDLSNTLVGADGRPSAPFALEPSAVGGGTVVYTGNVLRFQPDDFRRHTRLGDVPGAQLADWPLSYEELAPYYEQIEAEMGVAGDAAANPFEAPRSAPWPLPAVPLDRSGAIALRAAHSLGWHPFPIPTVAAPGAGRRPCLRCGLCTAYLCTANARWSARSFLLSASASGQLHLRTRATATRIVLDSSGRRAEAVEYLDERGQLGRVHARSVVLAANAIQTPRILLQSTHPAHPRGLANRSDQVGRNLMTHVMEAFLTFGHVPGADTTSDAAGCTVAIQDFYDRARSGAALSITLEPRVIGSFNSFRRMVTQPEGWPGLDEKILRARHRDHVVVLSMIEDLPRAQNRVRLHESLRDATGQPVPVIDYEPHPLDVEAAKVGAARSAELLAAAGARDIVSVPARTARFHTMGTCRMGDDPTRSVVDRNGRCHDVPNLYVADSSCFVTSAGVNPSLTVQALARRIGERLGAE